jgi:hypothetical protein
MFGRVLAAASGLFLAGCSVVGVRSGTEEPRFVLRAQVGAIEVRDYAPRIAAETTVAGDEAAARGEGFERIAGYIFGGNTARARIAMTAPVAQRGEQIAMTAPVARRQDAQGDWVISFFLPAASTMASLPVPNDARVRLVEVPGETIAALRFTGDRSGAAVAGQTRVLEAGLAASAWRADGPVQAWFYDPPWTLPPLRRNEVAVRVVAR